MITGDREERAPAMGRDSNTTIVRTMKRNFNGRPVWLFVSLAVLAVLCGGAAAAGNDAAKESLFSFATKRGVDLPNPHKDLSCDMCHREVPPDGAPVLAALKTLREKPSRLCATCHAEYVNIHPSDREPPFTTPPELPLDELGRVTCTTCHNLHLKSSEFYLLRGFGAEEGERYEARRDLCFACHGESFYLKNPHKAHKGASRCTYCHLTTPTKEDTSQTVKFRINVLQMCNFCHDVQRKFHPLNVDSAITVPDSLPRGADGSLHCGTCHNPHGVEETVHFLRKEYVEAVQGERRDAHGAKVDCTQCHTGLIRPGARPRLKYKGDLLVLCNSCHGTTGDMHPVGITIPNRLRTPTEVPLGPDNTITCLTCHSITCSAADSTGVGRSEIALRYFDRSAADNTLCFFCHSKKQWSGFSPHMEIDIRKKDYDPKACRFCHDIDPSRASDTADSVSFLPNPRMLCIRCHPERPHPAGFDHLVVPSGIRVPKQLPLDNDGSIVCTTCHDPHRAPQGNSRKRALGDKLCLLCHRK